MMYKADKFLLQSAAIVTAVGLIVAPAYTIMSILGTIIGLFVAGQLLGDV